MANLHEDAWRGTLDEGRLQRYLQIPATDIDAPGGSKNVTPLAAATWGGHLNVVRLLLDNPHKLANANALSPRSRTALYYATTRAPPENRAAIVRALLAAGADVDACSSEDGLNTPLMNAVSQIRDDSVVRELLDRGASLDVKNAKGKSARDLAKGTSLENVLEPKGKLEEMLGKIVDVIVAIVLFIIAYTNSKAILGAVEGVAKKLYNISGSKDPDIAKDLSNADGSEPKTAEEFKENLNNFVVQSGLEKFFAPGNRFLQTLADKAAALREDPTTSLGSPQNIKRLTRLSLYQPVIYCDDSGSMEKDRRYEIQCDLVTRIARIATKIVPDNYGVELRFINARSASNLSAAEMERAVRSVQPSGGTKIGTNLRAKILKPLLYDVLDNPNGSFPRPLLVCIITDGHPDPEPLDTFKNSIVECRRRLVDAGYEPTAAMFCVSQIGDDKSAAQFLQGLSTDDDISDVLFCTSDRLDAEFEGLKANERRLEEWLLETLTNPIMQRDEV